MGAFDQDAEACAQEVTMTRVMVSQDTLDFYYGYAVVDAVALEDEVYLVDATLYQTEGAVEVVPEAMSYQIEPGAQGGIVFGSSLPGQEPTSLVRCEDSPASSLNSLVPDEGKTEELVFEPGAHRAIVEDTLVRFAIHDYLVRASGGQVLEATLSSDGPPVVVVIDNDEYQPGDFDIVVATTNEKADNGGEPFGGWVWKGTLPHDGTYRVRVAHSGPAANGGLVSPYSLEVAIM